MFIKYGRIKRELKCLFLNKIMVIKYFLNSYKIKIRCLFWYYLVCIDFGY